MDALHKGVIHDPRGVEQDAALKFHHTPQNGVQLKTYELFISGVFHLKFVDHDWLQITETTES